VKPRFEWLDHTGDVGIRVYGRDLREIFVYATKALREALVSGEGRRQKKPLVIDPRLSSFQELYDSRKKEDHR